jgi:pyruvate kinase
MAADENRDAEDHRGSPIKTGDTLIIQRETCVTSKGRASVNYDRFVDEVQVGHRVLVEDGLLRFVVTEKLDDEVHCRCLVGGVLYSRKGVNLPDTSLSISALTDHDHRCIEWAIEHKLDYLALSFVRRATEMKQIHDRLRQVGSPIQLIAKIEQREAIQHLNEIIAEADGIMVARGDLGVEMDLAKVPIIQKEIIRRCRAAMKPVIVATQMLQSMVESASPTRAEVSDVANAIYDGTDAVMLSGETAMGKWPAQAVNTMAHVADVTEKDLRDNVKHNPATVIAHVATEHDEALAYGAWQMSHHLGIKLIAVWSQKGHLARILSKLRPPVPVVAVSTDISMVRRMGLYYGTYPMRVDHIEEITHLAPKVEPMIVEAGLANPGDLILIVSGTTLGQPGKSDAILIHQIPTREKLRVAWQGFGR